MNKQTQAVIHDMSNLAEDVCALMAATAGLSDEKVVEARRRVSAALERGKEIAGHVRDKAVEGVKAADHAAHEYPYQAMCIALGVGAIIGYLAARRCSGKCD